MRRIEKKGKKQLAHFKELRNTLQVFVF